MTNENKNVEVEQTKNEVKNFKGYVVELTTTDNPQIQIGKLVFKPGVVYAMSEISKQQLQSMIDCGYLSKDGKTGLNGFTVKKIG